MKYPLHTLILLLQVLVFCNRISAQGPEEIPHIDNPDADTLFYCGIPVAVAPGIVIENFDVEKPTDGIKISIVNYVPGEDTLFYTGNEFDSQWYPQLGNLEITGLGTAGELEDAVAQIYYENTSGSPATKFRSISISLLDADYLPESGHFYRYIHQADISWDEARAAAADSSYFGLQGYLATITSPVENDFIWSKIDGIGWIGATDEEEEDMWKWVTGPEGLNGGTIFWEGDASGQPVDSLFSNWSEGEPNDNFGEDYAHINLDPNKADKTWNDLPNVGGGGVYRSQGYIVEFGGMPDDPVLQLSAAAVIGVNQVPEVIIEPYDTLVCGDQEQQLSIQVDQDISTVLRPIDENSFVRDSTSLNPIVEVQETGRYRFELETYNKNQCSWFDTLSIYFQHQPVAELNIDKAECVDYNLQLSFVGEVEGDALFEWYRNDTVVDSGLNLVSAEINLEQGILNRTVGLKVIENSCADSIQIPVTVRPRVKIEAEPPEGCTPLNVQFGYTTTEEINEQFWTVESDHTSLAENPVFTFENAGPDDLSYDVSLHVISAEGCENSDTVENMVRIHPLPIVDLNFEESVCYEGNEEIRYNGNEELVDAFLWDLSGIPPGDVVQDPGFSAGPLQLNLTGSPVADIGLQVVSEFGCKSDTLIKTFKRKPSFEISEDTIGGCPPVEVELSVLTADFTDQIEYRWDFGNGQTAFGNPVSQVYSGENRFFDVTVVGESSLTGCANTIHMPGKIFVFPVPEASFTAEATSVLVTDPEIRFDNTSSGASNYMWDFGDNSFGSTAENPVHRFENLGFFDVKLFAVNNYNCLDSASTQIAVSFDKLFPPTAFSPNAFDAEDREFRIYADGIVNEGYKLLIFNRWGEVIFSSRTPEKGWDGTMKNGSNAPAGKYFWILEYVDFVGEEHLQKGSVTLLY